MGGGDGWDGMGLWMKDEWMRERKWLIDTCSWHCTKQFWRLDEFFTLLFSLHCCVMACYKGILSLYKTEDGNIFSQLKVKL